MERFTGHITKGDVIVIIFPFTDGSDAKPRPVLVVAEHSNNFIVCAITHNSGRDGEITLDKEDFQEGKLKVKSFIRPNMLLTINKNTVEKRIGSVKHFKLIEVITELTNIINKPASKSLPTSKALERPSNS